MGLCVLDVSAVLAPKFFQPWTPGSWHACWLHYHRLSLNQCLYPPRPAWGPWHVSKPDLIRCGKVVLELKMLVLVFNSGVIIALVKNAWIYFFSGLMFRTDKHTGTVKLACVALRPDKNLFSGSTQKDWMALCHCTSVICTHKIRIDINKSIDCNFFVVFKVCLCDTWEPATTVGLYIIGLA